LRVALDWGPLLDPPTGVGRYTRELALSLELLGTDLTRYAVAWGGGGRDEKVARWRVPARLAQASWRIARAPSIDRLTGPVDIVHATNFVLPALGRTPGVVTVHDLSYLREDTWPGGRRLRELVPWSLRRAAVVVVPTRAVASELIERYGVAAGRVHVTYEGVSPLFHGARPLSDAALGRMGITGPFVLAVGTLEPRKNLDTLLKAWKAASDSVDAWTLTLAGPRGWGPDLPRVDNVVPLGWVGDETLPGLLAAADLFCYPSLYEGFGLPPLEAMAAGTPALVGRYGCAEEVLGDAAELVDPNDVEAMSERLVALLEDPPTRQRMARAGRAKALTYTWDRTASATTAAYRAALEMG
jgi:glycosyltransferase involved in cell wall biosynthesis